jgi:hypothetical protein
VRSAIVENGLDLVQSGVRVAIERFGDRGVRGHGGAACDGGALRFDVYPVAQRTVEIGIRMALGTEPHDVRNMVMWQGMRLGAMGIAVGVPAAVMVARVMNSLIVGMVTWDPAVFAGVAAALAAVALIASCGVDESVR